MKTPRRNPSRNLPNETPTDDPLSEKKEALILRQKEKIVELESTIDALRKEIDRIHGEYTERPDAVAEFEKASAAVQELRTVVAQQQASIQMFLWRNDQLENAVAAQQQASLHMMTAFRADLVRAVQEQKEAAVRNLRTEEESKL